MKFLGLKQNIRVDIPRDTTIYGARTSRIE